MKRTYGAPQLKVYGSVEDMTKNSPSLNATDVPFGTIPVGDIDDVTSQSSFSVIVQLNIEASRVSLPNAGSICLS